MKTHKKQLQICKKVVQVTLIKMFEVFLRIDDDMITNDDEDLQIAECSDIDK